MRKSWMRPLITLVAAALGVTGVTAAGATPAGAASAASDTPLRVMPLGDSITWGVGSSTGNGYRARCGTGSRRTAIRWTSWARGGPVRCPTPTTKATPDT